MRVGWLCDTSDMLGGAELTQAEFRAAAPSGVEIVECRPSAVVPGLDRYVVQNCVTYEFADLEGIDAPTIKYWNDVGPHLHPGVHEWLTANATQICCSPVQAEYMGLAFTAKDVALIPPPVNLDRFAQAAEASNGSRAGAVCVGSWRNYGKAPHRVLEWADQNGGVDFYGGGVFAPMGSQEVPYEQMPELLARYERFVFLPTVIEPFGRLVAEAWASGLELVVNGLVGATYWITEKPEAIESAAEDFWKLVLS